VCHRAAILAIDDRPTLTETAMPLLKLPKYVEMPGHVAPVSGLGPGEVAEFVILTNFHDHVRKAAPLLDSVELERSMAGWEVSTITGTHGGHRVTVCCAGIGSGATSNVMEELINLGGRVFLQIGATGAIQERIGMGDIIVPTGSVRDEGLTRYYAPPQYPAVSDHRVVGALARAARAAGNTVHTGVIRTTDGFYPSQRIDAFVEQYHDLGVLSVEQEVAAILTVAATRGCYAGAALLVIGNLVTGEHSFNGDRPDLLETAWADQTRFVLRAIAELRSELAEDLAAAGAR
jgi:uridine phosphorylase